MFSYYLFLIVLLIRDIFISVKLLYIYTFYSIVILIAINQNDPSRFQVKISAHFSLFILINSTYISAHIPWRFFLDFIGYFCTIYFLNKIKTVK